MIDSVERKHLLAKRTKHKFSLEHQNMWYFQALSVYDLVLVQQDVQVNASRSFVNELDTTQLVLDSLQSIQQSHWL
jgi:hypothetical protein